MRAIYGITSAALVLVAAGTMTGCPMNPENDYYSSLVEVCGYPNPGGSVFSFDEAEIRKTTLTPACKEKLEPLIPYDETWDKAPADLKDHVTDAFRYILAYPLAVPPGKRILGLKDTAIPVDHQCIFFPEIDPQHCLRAEGQGANSVKKSDHPNLQKNIFNYILNRIDTVTYLGPSDSTVASYAPTVDKGRRLAIYDLFWSADWTSNFYHGPFTRAATIIHEARHGDGNPHDVCGGIAACDTEMGGAYGIEVSYFSMLLHGSAGVKVGDQPILSEFDLNLIWMDQCYSSQHRFVNEPAGFRSLFKDQSCQSGGNASELIAQEGLTQARYGSASAPTSGPELTQEQLGQVTSALEKKPNCPADKEMLKDLL